MSGSQRVGADVVFPAESRLPRRVTWRGCVVVSFGGAVLVTVSMGPMFEALGNVSALVWTGTAIIGAAQCALLAELTVRFPARAGGTPQYAHAMLARGSPLLGAISAWSYWVAWTPGIAVNVVVASHVVEATIWPGVNELVLAAAFAVGLYFLSLSGVRWVVRAGTVLGALVLAPLVLLLLSPLLIPSAFRPESLLPLSLPDSGSGDIADVAKWMFVAVWVSYSAEMASTLAAEVRDPQRTMPLAMAIAAGIAVLMFSVVPVISIGLVGAVASDDPTAFFLGPAELLLGRAGEATVGLMLTAALLLSAAAFVVGSSRTIYQLAEDGYLPARLAAVSGRGVPTGSLICDGIVIGVMLAVFGRDVIEFVAAANVAYLVVFVLMPIAYIGLHRRAPAGRASGFRLGCWAPPLAAALAAFNAVLLVVGGWQWGPEVIVTGATLVIVIVPISRWSRRARVAEPAAGWKRA